MHSHTKEPTTKVYVAGGWFSDGQMRAVREVEEFADKWFIKPFKPRTANLGEDGCDWDAIFKGNIDHIDSAGLVIASTVDKDMGTIWECGYAFSKGIPIVYYTPGIDKVNLMLAKSGKVAKTTEELFTIIIEGKEVGEDYGIE